jgi:hypothetical protein
VEDYFIISPRIKVIGENRLEVSFEEAEVADNKARLREQAGEIVPAALGRFPNTEALVATIMEEIQAAHLTDKVLERSHCVEEALGRLMRTPTLHLLYQTPQPIWEGYTTAQHSLGVAKTLAILAPNLTKLWLWALAGLLHDIGKTAAAFFEGDAKRGRQHQEHYNRKIAMAVLEALSCAPENITYILTLITQNTLLNQYFKGELNFESLNNTLESLTEVLVTMGYEITKLELLTDLKTFWVADKSDYSAVSCLLKGLPLKPSFDSQFVYVFTKGGPWLLDDIKLKHSWQTKYRELCQKLGN